MSRVLTLLAAWVALAWGGPSASSQSALGNPLQGTGFDRLLTRLFGTNSAFKANLEIQAKDPNLAGGVVVAPGKMTFLEGNSRFEVDMAKIKGVPMPPGMIEQMKQWGLAEVVVISRPDKRASYILYPALSAYADGPPPEAGGPGADAKYRSASQEVGREAVEGQACVKNKVVITDAEGKEHPFTVWNATQLKGFPIKIEGKQDAGEFAILFRDVKLERPELSAFEPPTNSTRFKNHDELVQTAIAMRVGVGVNADGDKAVIIKK